MAIKREWSKEYTQLIERSNLTWITQMQKADKTGYMPLQIGKIHEQSN